MFSEITSLMASELSTAYVKRGNWNEIEDCSHKASVNIMISTHLLITAWTVVY